MSKTVILLNPYGSDVTPYLNHTSGYAQLLNGTVADVGDTVYTLPYNNNVSSLSNIQTGEGLLDSKLKSTSGEILVFGYSEGCQIADLWLSNQGATPATGVDPSLVSFLLIGNADRKYGGFVYNRSVFNNVGYTGGKPDDTPYRVVDFVRQYDPIGDFPTATAIVNALEGLQSVTSDSNALAGAMQSVAQLMANGTYSNAVMNALDGLALIHTGLGIAGTGYMSVTVSDPQNLSLADGNITWIWSPTYPVPMLGVGGTFPQADQIYRAQIEQSYSRPVNIPMPDYGSNTAWGAEPFPLPASPPPPTGWWAELHESATMTGSGTLSATVTTRPVDSVSLTGSGQLTVGAAVGAPVDTVTLTGSGALSATAAPIIPGSASLAGSGALSAAVQGVSRTAAMSGSGSLSATAAVSGASYDALGAGYTSSSAGTTATWNHTAASGAYVLVFVAVDGSSGPTTVSSVKYGTSTMTQLGTVKDGANIRSGVNFYCYGLASAPGGAQTVTVTAAATASMMGNSISFTGVSSASTSVTSSGTSQSTALSQSATCTTGQLIVQAFEELTLAHITSYSGGTGRWLGDVGGTSGRGGMTISTATASTTFTASCSSADFWAAIAAVLS